MAKEAFWDEKSRGPSYKAETLLYAVKNLFAITAAPFGSLQGNRLRHLPCMGRS